jgi:hypothetical protein
MKGTHDSLVDARAQGDVLFHPDFIPFVDTKFSIEPLSSVWTKKKQNEAKKEQELTRQVPDGWTEDNTTSYKPPRDLVYSGLHVGPSHGPSSSSRKLVRRLV